MEESSESGPFTLLKSKVSSSSPRPPPSPLVSQNNEESAAAAVENRGDMLETEVVVEARHDLGTKTALSLILLIFVTSTLAMLGVYYSFPQVDPSEASLIKFPRDIEDAKKLGEVLSRYKEKYYIEVLGGFFCTYLFLQTFAIPGSIFLSIVSGFLFRFPVALFAVCFCSATGASFCYLLSYLIGRRLVRRYLPERSASWSAKVDSHRGNLLSYILFLRITPFLPNWFINIVAPVIGVPLLPFWIGSFFGVAPPSFVFIQAGTTLEQLTSSSDAITVQSVSLLVVFALLSLVPILLKNRLKAKFEWLYGPQGVCTIYCPRFIRSSHRQEASEREDSIEDVDSNVESPPDPASGTSTDPSQTTNASNQLISDSNKQSTSVEEGGDPSNTREEGGSASESCKKDNSCNGDQEAQL